MKKAILKTASNTIIPAEITANNIVVAKIRNSACILTMKLGNNPYSYRFMALESISRGGGYEFNLNARMRLPENEGKSCLEVIVEGALGDGAEVMVFERDEWWKALTWLVENRETGGKTNDGGGYGMFGDS